MPVKHIVNQRRFTRAGDAGHASEHAERNIDIDVFEIVLAGADDSDRRLRLSSLLRNRDRFLAGKIIARERVGNTLQGKRIACHFAPNRQAERLPYKFPDRSIPNQLTTEFATTGADVDQIISRANNLLFVFHDHQSVAFVAEVMHDPDETADIARM